MRRQIVQQLKTTRLWPRPVSFRPLCQVASHPLRTIGSRSQSQIHFIDCANSFNCQTMWHIVLPIPNTKHLAERRTVTMIYDINMHKGLVKWEKYERDKMCSHFASWAAFYSSLKSNGGFKILMFAVAMKIHAFIGWILQTKYDNQLNQNKMRVQYQIGLSA